MNVTPEKYVNICSDSQVAVKALQVTKTVSIGTAVPKRISLTGTLWSSLGP
jgi:hypothetical protein